MLNLGFSEILLILALALIVVGPDKLPEMMRFLGRQYGKLMRASNDLRRAFFLEAERSEVEQRAAELRRRREEARMRLLEQREALERGDTDAPIIAPLAQAPLVPGARELPLDGEKEG